MGKIDIYGWGGVNTTKNPIQLENNELTKAQNAVRDAAGQHGALVKRPGLTKINSIALSGSVNGFINVPLNLFSTRRFLIGVDQDVTAAYQWITSTDGFTATSTTTTPAACARPATALGWFGDDGVGAAVLTNRSVQNETLFIYPGDYTRGNPQPIRAWDGTVDKLLFEVPLNAKVLSDHGASVYASRVGAINHLLLVGEKLYLTSLDHLHVGTGHYSRIFEYDFATNQLQQIGQSCTGWDGDIGASSSAGTTGGATCVFTCTELHQGFLYAGVGPPPAETANSTAAGVYRIRPGVDTEWTYDFDNSGAADADLETVTCMASYKGLLYAGTTDQNSASARMLVRSTAGAWSQSTTVGSSTGSAWTDMKVFGDNLYACSYDDNAGTSSSKIHKFDGTSWSVVKTIDASAANPRIGVAMIVHNGVLYVLAIASDKNAIVTYSSNGTSWTDQTSNLTNSNIVSCFGVLAT